MSNEKNLQLEKWSYGFNSMQRRLRVYNLVCLGSFLFYFLFFLRSLAFESFSNVVLINPWKSPKAEAIPNITTKLRPATIVTIQVPVPIFNGTANNGLNIPKVSAHKSTLESFFLNTKNYRGTKYGVSPYLFIPSFIKQTSVSNINASKLDRFKKPSSTYKIF